MGELINRLTKPLSIEYLMKINEVFDLQGWDKEVNEKESLFSRFCIRLADLPNDETRDLFIELAKRYCWIPDDQYLNRMIRTIHKLFAENTELLNKESIYVYQLISPEDKANGKTKSSARVLYAFNDTRMRFSTELSNYKVKIIDSINSNNLKKINEDKSCLLLVDDYVGTGNTAESALKELFDNGVEAGNIYVYSIAAQKQGIEAINNLGVKVVADEIRDKGITDFYDEGVDAKKNVMLKASKAFKTGKDYLLGYGESEALITLIKTPNNTFPVFWREPNERKKAPFPRGWD